MHVSSRFAACLVFALAILITLGGIGVPNLQAQDQSQGGSCPQACPPPPCPVPECPKKPCCRATVPDCPCPRLQEPCFPPQCDTCCPVDPKEVRKAQKAADHAAHEAAEACRRQQRQVAKAQQRIHEAYEHGNHEIDEANAKYEKRRSEYADALTKSAELNALRESQTTVECEKPEAPKPAPVCEAPAPVVEPPTPAPTPSVTEPTPAPMPTPEPAKPITEEVKPKELPKTASPMELVGLIGLASTASAGFLARGRRG